MYTYPILSASPSLTAFVFAGGGSLGAIEVGMLRELLDHGVHPGCVIGASAGAINASGPVVDAVLASAAIFGVFPPVRIGGLDLVDGGVANNTPISVAISLGATRVIVLPAGFACALHKPPGNAIAQATHALTLLIARQLVRDLESYSSRAEIFVVPPLCPLDVSPYDYTQCDRLIERAAAKTRAWLNEGGLERAFIPGELREHTHA
jgi:NTE family protein